jgi:predicted metal-dependent peptidase
MIFFTDGYATYPEKPPRYPVLWVLTKDNQTPPFGKVCYVFDETDE